MNTRKYSENNQKHIRFKNIVSVILVCALMLSICAFAYQPNFSDTSAEPEISEIQKQAIILKKLGVLSFDDISEIDIEKKITRAEFADYIVNALQFSPITDKVYFSDVKSDYWAFGSINALVEKGVIDGVNNNTFEPENYVTYAQVCKMILSAAGYRGMIESLNYSDTMSAYITYTSRLKINENVSLSANDEINLADAVKLLYNGMKINNVFSAGGNGVVEEEDLFETYRNVYIEEGRVDAYFGGSISNRVCDSVDKVYIDDVEFTLDSDISAEEFFAENVEVTYIKYGKDERKVLYLEKANAKDEVINIASEQLNSFDATNTTLEYSAINNENSVKKIKIANGTKLVLNGEVSSKRISDVFNDFITGNTYGFIKLVKIGNEYSLCVVKSYEDYVLNTYNADENTYFGSSYSLNEVDFDEYNNLSVFDSSGNSVSLPTNKNSVVALAPSETKYYMEAVSCLNTVSGIIGGVKKTEPVVLIDGEEYELSVSLAAKTDLGSIVSTQVKAIFNLEGKIAYMDIADTGAFNLAYISKATVSDNVFSTNAIIKLYLPDTTELKDFTFADKVVIDEVTYKSEDTEKIFKAFPNGEFKKSGGNYQVKIPRQLIRYTVNEDGKINKIDTYNVCNGESSSNTLTRTHDGSVALRYIVTNKRFGMDCIYDTTNTKLFYVPKTNEDGEIVLNGSVLSETIDMYKSKVNIWNDRNYYVESYKLNDKNYYEDVIIVKMEPTKQDEMAFMFKEVNETVDSDGSVVKQLVGMTGSGEVKYIIDDDVTSVLGDIAVGDVVMANIDMTGTEVISLTKMFDRRTMTIKNDGTNPYWYAGSLDDTGINFRNQQYQLGKSYVYSINNGIARTTYDFYDMSKDIIDENMIVSALPVTVYDESLRGDSVVKGDVTDIRAYDTVGDNCSTIVVYANYGQLKQAFVYNN